MGTRRRLPTVQTDPLVVEMLAIHDSSKIKDLAITMEAGLSRGYISNLRRGVLTGPTVTSINALLGAHGYELVIRKKSSA